MLKTEVTSTYGNYFSFHRRVEPCAEKSAIGDVEQFGQSSSNFFVFKPRELEIIATQIRKNPVWV